MNRRDLLTVGATTAVANALWLAQSCGAQGTGSTTPHPPASGGDAIDALIRAATECATTCETCLARSIEHAASGMSEMAACARLSRECAELCRAVIVLATAGSTRLPELARICAAACDDCAAQCQHHASMEPACAHCAEVCPRCAEACRAVATS